MSLVRKRIVLPLIPTDIFQVIRPTQNKDAVLDLTYQQLLTALSEVFSGGGSLILLKTDGVDNGNQNLLNLVEGSGITLSDDGLGNITITSTGGTGGTYTVDNGLSPDPADPNNFQLGGPLVQSTTITNNDAYNLSVSGEYNGGGLFYVSNPIVTSFEDPTTYGIRSDTETGIAIFGNAVDNYGVLGRSENSVGVQAEADANYPLVATGNYITAGFFRCLNTTGKDALDVIRLIRIGGSAGASMSFETDDGAFNFISNRIKSRFPSTGLSQLAISGVDGGNESEIFSLLGTGQIQFNKYGVTPKTFTGTTVWFLAVDSSGAVIEVDAPSGTGTVTGTGTTNRLTKWTATSGNIADSSISDDGAGNVTILSALDLFLYLKAPSTGDVVALAYQKNNITVFLAGVDSSNDYVITSYNPSTGASVGRAIVVTSNTLNVTLASLAGTGSRMVVADTNGLLSTTAIPSGGGLEYAITTGTNTYAVTITGVAAYTDGDIYSIRFAVGNTAVAPTININGLGAKTLKKSVTTNLAVGDILANQVLIIQYDGTNFQVIGIAGGGSSGITSLTGDVTTPTGSSGVTAAALADSYKKGSAGVIFDGAGGVIATNTIGYVQIPYNGTITGWTLVSSVLGSCTVTAFKDTYTNFPPTTTTDDIFVTPPSISAASKARNLTAPINSPFETVTAGDWIGFKITGVTTVTWVNLTLSITKTV